MFNVQIWSNTQKVDTNISCCWASHNILSKSLEKQNVNDMVEPHRYISWRINGLYVAMSITKWSWLNYLIVCVLVPQVS
jgi:hypothetical protein